MNESANGQTSHEVCHARLALTRKECAGMIVLNGACCGDLLLKRGSSDAYRISL